MRDLRHNFAAFGAGGGMGLPIIGKLLGHTQPRLRLVTPTLMLIPCAADTIGANIAAAMGEPLERAGNVSTLRSR